MPKKLTLAGAVVAGGVAIGLVVAGAKPEPTGCVARARDVSTCLRDMPALGPMPAVTGVLMSEGTPFPAAEARGEGCTPVPCDEPRKP